MGHVDPVGLAHQILPHDDLPAVVRYNSAPYRPTLDLSSHEIITAEDVLFVGLTYVGFDGPRQNIVEEKSRERFFSHFKLCPEAILDSYRYFNEHGGLDTMDFKWLLITLSFLKLCKSYCAIQQFTNLTDMLIIVICFIDDTEHVLSGRWRLDEGTLSHHIWNTLWQIQHHFTALIYLDPSEWDPDQVHIVTVDTVNYNVEEQRSDPVGKFERWYNHKSHSAGVKYEMAFPLCLNRVRVFCSKLINMLPMPTLTQN